MIKYLITSLLLLFVCGTSTAEATTVTDLTAEFGMTAPVVDHETYIRRYKDIAVREMERSGVPASIKLAQGLLESDAGRSRLARSAKNHFGIKCGSRWNGETYYKEDDDYDDRGQLIKSCFRQYRNPEASFVAHSEFLRDPAKSFRYGFLFRLDPTDYRQWAEGLRRAGYATNPRYPQLLISLIERYNLQQYDQSTTLIEEPEIVTAPVEELQRGILRTNDVNYFINDAPISVVDIARQVDLSVERLLSYNEELNNEGDRVDPGERVFLQKKRRSFRGYEQYHTVQEGEDLYDIAQRYGLRLDILSQRNRLREDSDPATGEQIKLRGRKVKVDDVARLEGETIPGANNPNIPTDDDGRIIIDDPTDTPTTKPTPPDPRPSQPSTTTPSTTTPTSTRPIPATPVPPTLTNPPGQTTNPPVNTGSAVHVVAAGETLYAISRKYGLTVDQLKQLNRLTTNTIAIGQRLLVR